MQLLYIIRNLLKFNTHQCRLRNSAWSTEETLIWDCIALHPSSNSINIPDVSESIPLDAFYVIHKCDCFNNLRLINFGSGTALANRMLQDRRLKNATKSRRVCERNNRGCYGISLSPQTKSYRDASVNTKNQNNTRRSSQVPALTLWANFNISQTYIFKYLMWTVKNLETKYYTEYCSLLMLLVFNTRLFQHSNT